MKQNQFLSIIPQLLTEYGITISEDTAIELGMVAYNKIGNANVLLKVICAHPVRNIDGWWEVCLPCDVYQIEAVCLPFEIGLDVSATDDFLGYKTYPIENWIESFKRNKDLFYLSGAFVKYTEAGDKLYFSEPYPAVHILYKKLIVDPETDLPYLSENELECICAYIAYAEDLKKARINKDLSLLNFAQLEYKTFQQLCSKARAADSFSQNEINEILDTLTSFDVHKYGVSSTKPIK